jgi:hypothetical protein
MENSTVQRQLLGYFLYDDSLDIVYHAYVIYNVSGLHFVLCTTSIESIFIADTIGEIRLEVERRFREINKKSRFILGQ